MNVLSWNCRGLGNPLTVQTLRRLVRTKKPNLVFLMETKQVSKSLESVRVKLGFEANFVVDSIGRSGGLALLWNLETKVEVQNFSRRHINATVLDEKTGNLWNFTGFYGNPETARRSESWAILRFLSKINPAPWLCVGDFNEITNVGEKSSSSYRSPRQMQEFKKVLEDCQLLDLGYEGPRFTWCNGRYGASDFTRRDWTVQWQMRVGWVFLMWLKFRCYLGTSQIIIQFWCLFQILWISNGLKAGCLDMRLAGLNRRIHRTLLSKYGG